MRQQNVRYVVVGLAGVGLLIIGLVSGLVLGGAFTGHAAPAHAQAGILTSASATTDMTRYCQTYEQTLESQLNVNQQTLEAANVKAIQATLAQMATDGQITQTEEQQFAAIASQLGTNVCANLNQQSIMGALTSNSLLTSQFLAARGALLGGTSKALKLDSATLSSDLASGKTVAALAQAQHVDLTSVESAYLDAANAFLTQDVTNGVITSAQKDAISAMLQKRVAQGHFPLLDGGMAGMMGGQ